MYCKRFLEYFSNHNFSKPPLELKVANNLAALISNKMDVNDLERGFMDHLKDPAI